MAESTKELHELVEFLHDERPAVRKGAVEAVLGLTASEDGRALLRTTKVAVQLRRLIGGAPGIAQLAVKAMINLSADAELLDQMLKQGMVNALMETLRDDDCSYKRLVVVLMTNLSQTLEGCDQLMQKGDAGGALVGLHVRRMLQWFVAPRPAASSSTASAGVEGDESDTFEYVACILQNVTQLHEARVILLEPERGILPALIPQLQSRSAIRRRGVAATLRNCLFETDDKYVRYMLAPSVDIVTALLLPLAGPDRYSAEEKAGMHASLYRSGARKVREGDPPTRRALVEALQLIAGTRPGREHLRRVKAYAVIKAFHEWLEGAEAPDESSLDAAGVAAAAAHHASPGAMVGDRADGDESELSPDDEATVTAINAIVQQLFREDEVKHTSEVIGGRGSGVATGTPSTLPALEDAHGTTSTASTSAATLTPGYGSKVGGTGPSFSSGSAAQLAAAQTRAGVKIVPLDEAKRAAAAIASGSGWEGSDADVSGLVTELPDWTEADPYLPPAFQVKKAPVVGGGESGDGSADVVKGKVTEDFDGVD